MRITMKDIAKEAGVSIATVSHVINGSKNISPDKRKVVLEAIEKLNYSPNLAAKSLRCRKTNTVALIVSSFMDSYITSMVRGVSNRAWELGYNLLFLNTNENQQYEQESVKLLSSGVVDGIIISPTSSTIDYLNDYLEQLPIVLVNRYDPKLNQLPWVTVDDYQVGYDATAHLLQHGHKDIGLILAVPNVTTTINRIAGYKAALEEYGVPFNEDYFELGHATVDGGFNAVKLLLRRHKEITAIFSLSDLMTIGAIKAFKTMSIQYPQDVALIGFGDFDVADVIEPSITCVSPPDTVGRTVFDMLMNRINNNHYDKHIQLPASLIIRKSCGCQV